MYINPQIIIRLFIINIQMTKIIFLFFLVIFASALRVE